ncbi:MAG: addiction module protein [Acidobacteria bacterium]|nr:MAG: addiction module protein [Acidobacteriota bacterium]PYR16119.1 MAG: addiction module protein [Acidobacteriota bacterium]PYR54168.1 MAG: addiction module protein [Acidobacteriota bacterium]
MPHSLPLPPPGFDDLPVDEQIDYVQSLWDHIAASVDQVPLHEWQQAILEERLAAHRRAPQESRPWEEVIERLQGRLRDRR